MHVHARQAFLLSLADPHGRGLRGHEGGDVLNLLSQLVVQDRAEQGALRLVPSLSAGPHLASPAGPGVKVKG